MMHALLERLSFRRCDDVACKESRGWHSHHFTALGRARFTGRRWLRWV